MPNGVAEQQKLKVLLVDDEPIAQLSLKALLGRHPSIEICGTAENGEDALEHIARECPDVLFL
ncbi:MAG: DNA-binding response regulator, partial [Verrucomicrobiota bacterium]